MLIYFLETWC